MIRTLVCASAFALQGLCASPSEYGSLLTATAKVVPLECPMGEELCDGTCVPTEDVSTCREAAKKAREAAKKARKAANKARNAALKASRIESCDDEVARKANRIAKRKVALTPEEAVKNKARNEVKKAERAASASGKAPPDASANARVAACNKARAKARKGGRQGVHEARRTDREDNRIKGEERI